MQAACQADMKTGRKVSGDGPGIRSGSAARIVASVRTSVGEQVCDLARGEARCVRNWGSSPDLLHARGQMIGRAARRQSGRPARFPRH